MGDDNNRGIELLSDLEHYGMSFPAGARIDLFDNALEEALVAAGAAQWIDPPVPDQADAKAFVKAADGAGLGEALAELFAANPGMQEMLGMCSAIRRASGPALALETLLASEPAEDSGVKRQALKTVASRQAVDDLFRRAAKA